MLSLQQLRELNDPSALAAAVAAALLGAVYLLSRSRQSSSKALATENGKNTTAREVPTLTGTLPLLGDALEVTSNHPRFHYWILDRCRDFKFGPWQMNVPGQEMYIFSDPRHFEEILSTQFDNFPKGEYQLDMVSAFFGRSVVGSDGERWYHQRKTAIKFFTARSLRAYMETSAKRNAELVLSILQRGLEHKTPVNLTKLMLDFTMQTFAETGLGIKLDWIGRDEPHPFTVALDESAEIISKRFVRPGWFWRLQRALNIGYEAKLAKNMAYVVSWITDVVNEAIKESGAAKKEVQFGEEDVKSMVELFVEHSRDDAEGLRPHDIVDFIQVMIIAARDTTAIAATWFFYLLTVHPRVEAKIRQELLREYPDRVGKRTNYFTPEETRPLVYLEATLKESLRLQTPAPFLFKETAVDTVIDNDIFVPKGKFMGLSMFAAARNPAVWGEDADEFRPERWIDPSTGQIRPTSSYKFSSFSAGPRSCVGMTLAMMELRAIAVNVLSRFHFQLAEPVDGLGLTTVLFPMKDTLIVNVLPPTSGVSAAA